MNKKVRDVIGIDLPKNPKTFPDFVKALANINLDTQSPGIALSILGLAVDLADAEYRKAQVRITILKRRAELLEAMTRNVADSSIATRPITPLVVRTFKPVLWFWTPCARRGSEPPRTAAKNSLDNPLAWADSYRARRGSGQGSPRR